MKKTLLLFVLLLFAACLWAAKNTGEENAAAELPVEKKEPFRFHNRMFEIGLNLKAGVSNDYMSVFDIFQEHVVIDINDLEKGLKLDFAATVTPFFFNFNWKDVWGWGLFISTETAGNVSLSGNMLSLNKADNDKFGAGGAAFLEAGFHTFFPVNKKWKLKIRPSAYLPLVYTEPGLTYTYQSDSSGKIKLALEYDVKVFTAVSIKSYVDGTGSIDPMGILNEIDFWSLGYDLGLGIEYLYSRRLNFGLDIVHIPMVPAKLNNYIQMKGRAAVESDDLISDLMNNAEGIYKFEPGTFEPQYGSQSRDIFRPFKIVCYADYRPFRKQPFFIIPSLGLSYNLLYPAPFSMEGGLKFRYDLANIFITAIGSRYEDHQWKNSLDLAFNFRAFEIDVGAALQSPDFLKSFSLTGVEISAAVKLGW